MNELQTYKILCAYAIAAALYALAISSVDRSCKDIKGDVGQAQIEENQKQIIEALKELRK
jgi:hypothetical protein